MNLLPTLFVPLLVSHLLGDFMFQPKKWVENKRIKKFRSWKLVIHAVINSVLPYIFLAQWQAVWILPVLFISHYLLDGLKSCTKENIFIFSVDQFIHLLILFLIASSFREVPLTENSLKLWSIIAVYLMVTSPASVFIDLVIRTIIPENNSEETSKASIYIGILERILIVTFIFVNQLASIGFLIAAKSIFRFNETKEDHKQKAEYFLLGTLISFTVAIIIGLGCNVLIK